MTPAPVPPTATALLIVECQEGVVGKTSALPALAEQAAPVLPVIGRLAVGARAAGVVVCHLTFVPLARNRSSNRKPVLFQQVLPLMDDWGPGHPGTLVVDEIGVGPDDLVLPRASGVSPTHGTETFKVLRNLGVQRIVVAGVSTNVALPAVLTGAVDEGFETAVPTDAVVGTPADYAEASVRHTLAFLARLTTVDALLAEWAGADA